MAFLFVCTRQAGNLLDYGIYGRDMAPVGFEETFFGLALWHDPCTDMSEFCLIQGVPAHIYLRNDSKQTKSNGLERNRRKRRDKSPSKSCSKSTLCPTCDSKFDSLCTRCYEQVKSKKRDDFVLVYQPAYVRVNICMRLHLTFPSDLAFYVFRELRSSQTFRKRFCRFVRRRFGFRDMRNITCSCEGVRQVCQLSFSLPYAVEIVLELADTSVCLAWCYRLETLLRKRVIMEETMAWLSTLGGGYSSLGDYFLTHSTTAGHISVTQLRISMEMGDPIMAAKCRLFFALSLMQRGALKQSKEMIRKEFHFAKSMVVRDQKLIDMCHGLWSKLRYYRFLNSTKSQWHCRDPCTGCRQIKDHREQSKLEDIGGETLHDKMYRDHLKA